jgi:hypothetical protein
MKGEKRVPKTGAKDNLNWRIERIQEEYKD